VVLTMVDGQILVRQSGLLNQDIGAITAEARAAAATLTARAGL
jgi:hypothetical protein